ncbi:sensor histidine kinase [Desulforamulus aeronauticus]|nr:ATP-binding protein [Desulforamulus aeronauticus]
MSLLQLLFVSLPEVLLITALSFQLTGLRLKLLDLIVVGLLQTIVAYLVRLSPIPFGVHSIIQIIIFIVILRIITRNGFRVVIITALLGLTIYASLEALIAPTLLNLSGYDLNEVIYNPLMRIIFFFPQAVMILLFIFFCKKFSYRLVDFSQNGHATPGQNKNILDRSYFYLYVLVLLPVQLMALLNIVFFTSQTNTFSNQYLNFLIASFSLIIVFITVLSMGAIKKISTLIGKESEAKSATETISQLDKLIQAIRKTRHDHNHHLQTIYGLLEINEYEMAREYMHKLHLHLSTPAQLVKTDHLGVTALLYAKAGLAEIKGLDFEVQVDDSLKDIPLSTIELNSVLGNLIDNAIEAAADKGEGEKVRLEISTEPGEYQFVIANSGHPIPQEIMNQIFETTFSTKGKNRGLGLPIIKEITEKYSGTIEINTSPNETVFILHIPIAKE